ncbi:MAG: extracellular solute-binding protein [Christensenellaceae bacterium]|nr:extracellular solute-binding protein [Christensenellaceae bacterium]
MKKTMSLLLCVLLLLTNISVFAAEATATPEPVVVPEGRIRVDYWCTFTGANGEFIQTTIDEYNASQEKYFVVKQYNGNYMEMLAKMQTSNQSERPHLVTGSTEQVGTMKYSGLIRRMDSILKNDEPMVTKLYGNLKSTWGDEQGLVGYPLGNSMSQLAINKKMAETAGVDPYSIISMEDLYEAAQKIQATGLCDTVVGTDHSGIYPNYSMAIEGIHVLDNNNGADALPSKVLTGESPAKEKVMKYLEICQKMQLEGLWYPLGASWGGEVLPAACSGDIAIITGTIGGYGRILRAWREAHPDDKENAFVLVPWVSVTREGKHEGMPASGTGFYVIDNGDPDGQDGAVEYMRYFCSNEVQKRWLKQTGYMPLTPEILEDKEFVEWLNEDRPEVWHLINQQDKMGSDSFYPVNPIDTEWKDCWIRAVEKVTSDTSYDIEKAVDEMTVELQDALDMWLLTNNQ